MTESQERFVRAILGRLPAPRVAEMHVFPPLRQGAAETGVAVIAARREGELEAEERAAEAADAADADAADADAADADAADAPEGGQDEPEPVAARGRGGRAGRRVAGDSGMRHTVFTARYRLTIRGPERGKWEFDLVEEADAPLITVDAVVRGVQERAGEGGEPERLGPDALAALAGADGSPPWTTARP